MKSNELNGAALAYLGDAVIELIARERALKQGITDVGKLNEVVVGYVRATAQSQAVVRLEAAGILTEAEQNAYRRGRNVNGISIPKSASAAEYRRATGLEALFAHLYLNGEKARIEELFDIAYGY